MNFSLNFFFFFLLSIPREYISTDFIILATRRIFRIVIQIERNDTIFFFFFFEKCYSKNKSTASICASKKKKKKKTCSHIDPSRSWPRDRHISALNRCPPPISRAANELDTIPAKSISFLWKSSKRSIIVKSCAHTHIYIYLKIS